MDSEWRVAFRKKETLHVTFKAFQFLHDESQATWPTWTLPLKLVLTPPDLSDHLLFCLSGPVLPFLVIAIWFYSGDPFLP